MNNPELAFPPFPSQADRSPFDRVEFIKTWFGLAFWGSISKSVSHQRCTVCFRKLAEELGVTCPEAIASWYELYWGGGSWAARHPGHLADHEHQAAERAAELREMGRSAWYAIGHSVAAGATPQFLGLSSEDQKHFLEGWNEAQAEEASGSIH